MNFHKIPVMNAHPFNNESWGTVIRVPATCLVAIEAIFGHFMMISAIIGLFKPR